MGRKYGTTANQDDTEIRFSLTNDDYSSAPRSKAKITKFSDQAEYLKNVTESNPPSQEHNLNKDRQYASSKSSPTPKKTTSSRDKSKEGARESSRKRKPKQ